MNESELLWGILFGAIGLGMFVYGRRQRTVAPFVCGLALMGFPYFVSDTLMLVIIGIALILGGLFVRFG